MCLWVSPGQGDRSVCHNRLVSYAAEGLAAAVHVEICTRSSTQAVPCSKSSSMIVDDSLGAKRANPGSGRSPGSDTAEIKI